ncbi:MAG: hypothetical protein SGJ26_04280 [Nitrospirota bacterium]|nr:hypothetical protein [Nitrospirota bacterium]
MRKHDTLAGLEDAVTDTLQRPRYIRMSKEDDRVFLYYAPRGKYVLCVVCRHLNGDGFIITAYLTDRIKKGVTVYETDSGHL